jgi:hypothetical protein
VKNRPADGSAGDANYGAIGVGYSRHRQPDPRIATRIHAALRDACTVVNVGAGTGSYEPTNRRVVAVEPSASMRDQRPPHLSRATNAVAERLPFRDRSFDAAMATFTIHQWRDLAAGLTEMRRVSRGPVVILTCAPEEVQRFWLSDYAPDVLAAEARRYPSMHDIEQQLGTPIRIEPVPIPFDCRDGFNEAYFGRPEMLLDAGARLSCSAWSFVPQDVAREYVDHLASDLLDGTWDRKFGHLRTQREFSGSLYLVVSDPA